MKGGRSFLTPQGNADCVFLVLVAYDERNDSSRFFFAVALPLLAAAIVLGLRVMPAKGTSWLVHVDVGLAWFSALSTMVLVPTDVATTLEVGQDLLLVRLLQNCRSLSTYHRPAFESIS